MGKIENVVSKGHGTGTENVLLTTIRVVTETESGRFQKPFKDNLLIVTGSGLKPKVTGFQVFEGNVNEEKEIGSAVIDTIDANGDGVSIHVWFLAFRDIRNLNALDGNDGVGAITITIQTDTVPQTASTGTITIDPD